MPVPFTECADTPLSWCRV